MNNCRMDLHLTLIADINRATDYIVISLDLRYQPSVATNGYCLKYQSRVDARAA